jgi:nicotinamide-nucleotide amidase
MRCEILTVGTELLSGLIAETNSSYITQKLAEIGLACERKTSINDDAGLVSETIRNILLAADVLIITGGLGSTHDDVTREGLADAISKKLILRPLLAASLEQKINEHGQSMREAILRQAYLPEGAEPIVPSLGTAPGIIVGMEEKFIFALPGVPSEMQQMLTQRVIPFLKDKYPQESTTVSRIIKTCGAGELLIEEKIERLIDRYPGLSFSIIPQLGEVQLQLVARDRTDRARLLVNKAEAEIRLVLDKLVYGVDRQTLEEVLGELLRKHELKIMAVESCTGGELSQRISNVSGSSDYFWGTMVTYSNEAKRKLVGVSCEDLLHHGAVSGQVAIAMAEGGRHVAQADIGLSITGIAGPGGGTKEKPVGLVFVGLSWCEGSHCRRFQFLGSRDEIRARAAQAALNMMRLFLLEKFENTGGEVS